MHAVVLPRQIRLEERQGISNLQVAWDLHSARHSSSPIPSSRLLARGEGCYRLGKLKDGAVFDVEVDITLETVRGPRGEVLGFDVRWVDDSLIAEIRR